MTFMGCPTHSQAEAPGQNACQGHAWRPGALLPEEACPKPLFWQFGAVRPPGDPPSGQDPWTGGLVPSRVWADGKAGVQGSQVTC